MDEKESQKNLANQNNLNIFQEVWRCLERSQGG